MCTQYQDKYASKWQIVGPFTKYRVQVPRPQANPKETIPQLQWRPKVQGPRLQGQGPLLVPCRQPKLGPLIAN